MFSFLKTFNYIFVISFFVLYFYQTAYVGVGLLKGSRRYGAQKDEKKNRFAVIISARNESVVIGELLKSINAQEYPKELVDIYVVADNCTDNTAQIAAENGAIVYERFNKQQVGKGYALDYLFGKIKETCGLRAYDGYMVFDADNVLDPHYIAEVNHTFNKGYRVITSYRNTKNYGSSWISAGYGLMFLRESRYINGARMACKTSCAISGTGFTVSSEIIEKNDGWKHHLLTEDIEFSVDNVAKGELIGYCSTAVLYDEQPITFKASWHQRLRWSKGFYQVFYNYGARLFKGCFTGRRFSCYDMLLTVMPMSFMTILMILVNCFVMCWAVYNGRPILTKIALQYIALAVWGNYCSLLFVGALTTVTEWNRIYCAPIKKILFVFTYPVFILSNMPICIVALFKPVYWRPIPHTISKNLQEIQQ